MPSIDQIRQAKEQSRSDELIRKRLAGIEQAVNKTSSSIIKYLDNKITRTQIVNQLESVKTPDVQAVVDVLEQIRSKLVPADMSEIIGAIQDINATNKQILDKEAPDNSRQLEAILDSSLSIKDAIDAKDMSVKVDAPVVNVAAPDMSQIIAYNQKIIEAIRSIKISNETDTSTIEDNQKEILDVLEKIYNKPISAGGGGSIIPPRLIKGDSLTVVNPDGTPINDNLPTDYATENSLNAMRGFQLPVYDEIQLGYTGQDLTTVDYYDNSVKVATLTLSYNSGNLVGVVQS